MHNRDNAKYSMNRVHYTAPGKIADDNLKCFFVNEKY